MTFLQSYANALTKRPKLIFTVMWSVIFLLVVIVGMQNWVALSEETDYDWSVNGAVQVKQLDAYQHAQATLKFIKSDGSAGDSGDASINRTSTGDDTLSFVYEIESDDEAENPGGVFSLDNLKLICDFENVLYNFELFEQFCQKECPGVECGCAAQPTTVSYLFYGPGPGPYKCDTLDQAQVDEVLNDIRSVLSDESPDQNSTAQLQYYSFFISSGFEMEGVDPAEWTNFRSRSIIQFGWPLEEEITKDLGTADDVTLYLVDELWAPVEAKLFETLGMEAGPYKSHYETKPYIGPVRLRFFGARLLDLEFPRVVTEDFTAVGFSVILVFVFLRTHLGSFFLATVSIFQMLMSIPVALFFYRGVFQVDFFTQLHILAIFLILGVGADDVFVFVDKWKQTDKSLPLEDRMAETIGHTAAAVFNTSFTTAVAFFATAVSPIMPISAFGIFAAMAIMLNYVFCITLTPVTILVFEKHLHGNSCKTLCLGGCTGQELKGIHKSGEHHDLGIEETAKTGVPKFMHHTYAPFLNRRWGPMNLKWGSIGLVSIGSVVAIVALIFATQLDTPKEQEVWFRGGHMFNGVLDLMGNGFSASEETRYMPIEFVFGISDVDRSDFNHWVPSKNRGSAVYDESFNLDTPESRQSFADACQLLRDSKCDLEGCKQGPTRDILLYDPSTVVCFMDDYLVWETTNAGFITNDFSLDLQAYLVTAKGSRYSEYVAFDPDTDKIRMAVIGAVASVLSIQPNHIMRPFYDKLVEVSEVEIRALDPARFGSVFPTGGQEFTWMETQVQLVAGMFQGLAICLPVCFAVLLFATSNLILSLFATGTVAIIVVCVLGLASAIGWDLGTAESIAAVIVIGFAIDYSVHLAHIYEIAEDKSDRGKRVDEALTRMGHTVVAGAVTTFASGAMMFICQLTFFLKMAVFICATIGLSLFFALGFLMALCALAGPEGHFGDLSAVAAALGLGNPKTEPSVEIDGFSESTKADLL